MTTSSSSGNTRITPLGEGASNYPGRGVVGGGGGGVNHVDNEQIARSLKKKWKPYQKVFLGWGLLIIISNVSFFAVKAGIDNRRKTDYLAYLAKEKEREKEMMLAEASASAKAAAASK